VRQQRPVTPPEPEGAAEALIEIEKLWLPTPKLDGFPIEVRNAPLCVHSVDCRRQGAKQRLGTGLARVRTCHGPSTMGSNDMNFKALQVNRMRLVALL
jgi:hypothetical protein